MIQADVKYKLLVHDCGWTWRVIQTERYETSHVGERVMIGSLQVRREACLECLLKTTARGQPEIKITRSQVVCSHSDRSFVRHLRAAPHSGRSVTRLLMSLLCANRSSPITRWTLNCTIPLPRPSHYSTHCACVPDGCTHARPRRRLLRDLGWFHTY